MTRLRGIKLALACASAALLAACGGGDTTEYGEMLRRGISANPDTLDPHKASAQWENIVIGDMFDGLFVTAADGRPVPGVAESYEVDDTQTVWTFKLRETVWSDGTPLTAHDFVFAFHRLQAPETAGQYASLMWVIKNAQEVGRGDLPPEEMGVRAIDDYTLELTLNYPAPYLPGLLSHYSSYPVPRHAVEEFGDRWVRPENIVVNGPYKLVDWTVGSSLLSVANEHWAGREELCFDTVAYFPIADMNAAERLIEAGELDINNAFEGPRKEQIDRRLPGWARTSASLTTTYWAFKVDEEPFSDVRVRRALAMALDREYMTENVLTPGFIPAYSLVPPGIDNYVDPENAPRFDWADMPRAERLIEARELLEQAGYGPDNPLEFTYTYRNTSDNTKPPPVAQANWRQIADWVEPELRLQETRVLYEMLRQGDFEFSDAAWIADFNDPHNFLYLLDSETGQLNYGNYANAQYDALIAQSNTELDLERRAELMAQAEQIMLDEVALSPMWFQVSQNMVDPELLGWQDNVVDIHRSRYFCRP